MMPIRQFSLNSKEAHELLCPRPTALTPVPRTRNLPITIIDDEPRNVHPGVLRGKG